MNNRGFFWRVILAIAMLACAFVVWERWSEKRGTKIHASGTPETNAKRLSSLIPSPRSASSAPAVSPGGVKTGAKAPTFVPSAGGLNLLLSRGTKLASRESPADSDGRWKRESLFQTDFKYPSVKIEETLGTDTAGQIRVLGRVAMAADHILVKFPPASPDIKVLERKLGPQGIQKTHTPGLYLVRLAAPGLDSVREMLASIQSQKLNTISAEPDYLVESSLAPNDPSFVQTWGLSNKGQSGGVANADIDAVDAWGITTGSRAVRVAVIDTGIDSTHPDLAANIWSNPSETAGNGIDDDQNGFSDDTQGWNFYANTNDPMDDNNHGTHVAGTLGAAGNDGQGIAGVCWNVSLVALKFLSKDGVGATSDAVDAINYATSLGVDVMSNSWAGGAYSAALKAAIDDADQHGILFVAAAGNGGFDGIGDDNDSVAVYPASYPCENIIAVAASDDQDNLTAFSNYGATTVHIAAPGSAIYSTVTGGRYATYAGTSMATPHVAGACALLKSAGLGLTHLQIKERILASADQLPSCANKLVSGGRLNLYAALKGVSPGSAAITSPANARATVGGLFSYTITANNSPSSFGAIGLPIGLDVDTSTGVISGTALGTGTSVVTLKAFSRGEGTATAKLSLVVAPPIPVITSGTLLNGMVGSPLSYRIVATNAPTGFAVSSLPPGVTLDSSSGIISGIPSASGTTDVTVYASNWGGTGSASLRVDISNPPIPQITSPLNATGMVGAPFTYAITASNNPSVFSASGLPAGLLVDSASGIISGTPASVGTSTITLNAANLSGTGSAELTLTINNAQAPVITSASSVACISGEPFSYTILATNQPTAFSAADLPPGLSLNTFTGVISGTPTGPGVFNATLGAMNSGGTGVSRLVVTVNPPKPVVTSSVETVTVGTFFSYSIVATNSPTGFTADSLPEGLSFDANGGTINGTPVATGTFTIPLGAANVSGTGTGTLTLKVVPLAPKITSPTSATAKAGVAFSYTITAENLPTSFGASGLPAGLTINPSTGLISGRPQNTGTYSATIRATNPGGTGTAGLAIVVGCGPTSIASFAPLSAAPGATVTVQGTGFVGATNVVITDKRTGANSAATFNVISDSTLQFCVPNINPLGFGAVITVVTPNGAAVTLPSSATLISGTVHGGSGGGCYAVQSGGAFYGSGGSNTIYLDAGALATAEGSGGNTYYVEDGATLDLSAGGGGQTVYYTPQATLLSGASISSVVNGSYTPVSALTRCAVPSLLRILAPPQITGTNAATGQVGSLFAYTIRATNFPQSFSASGLPDGLNLNPTTGTISGTPTQAGVFPIVLSATNGDGSTSMTLTLTITDPLVPIINSAKTVAVAFGSPISYAITATNNPTSFSATDLPDGLTLDPATGFISGTPSAAGTYSVTLGATNAHGTGSTVLLLLIGTEPTSITGIVPAQAGPDATITLQGTGFLGASSVIFTDKRTGANTAASFAVTSATTLEVTVPRINPLGWGAVITVVTPSGAAVTVPATARIISSGSNSGSGSGFYVVENGASLSGGGGGNAVYVKSGGVAASGGGGSNTYYLESGALLDLSGGGGGMTVFYVDGATILNPGNASLTALATLQQSPVEALFQVLQTPYLVTGSQTASGSVGTPFSFAIQAANRPTSFSSSALPPGLALDSSTGIISGIPTAGGSYEVNITASNADGTGMGTLTINIAGNVPPVITSAATVTGSISQPFSYTILASNGASSFSASGLPAGLVIDSSTGVISGTPLVGGVFNVVLGAINAYGTGNLGLTLLLSVNPTRITSYSPAFVTVSSTMTLTGQGFAGASAVVFTDRRSGASASASFSVQSDTEIQAVVPNLSAYPGNPFPFGLAVTIVSPSGATTLVPANATVIASNTSSVGGGNFYDVKSGATLTGPGGSCLIYLEAGSASIAGGSGGNTYFVEDNATLNLNGYSGVTVYCSAGATILNPGSSVLVHIGGLQKSPVSSLPNLPPIPTITSSTQATTPVNASFAYTIAAFNNPTSYSASGLPAGLGFNSGTGLISGTPTSSGTYSVNLGAINANGTGTATLNLIVRDLLVPAITSTAKARAEIGQPFAFVVTASNSPVSFSASPLPPGLSFNADTGAFSGTPTTSGVYSISLTASNSDGSGTGTLSLKVSNPYSEWKDGIFPAILSGSNSALAADLADADHDGISNMMEYGLGLNPLVPNKRSVLPSTQLNNVNDAPGLDFQFRRLKGKGTGSAEGGYTVGGVTYVVEVSSDLVHWQTGPALMSQVGSPIDNGDSTETVTVRVRSEGKQQFVRLKLVNPE